MMTRSHRGPTGGGPRATRRASALRDQRGAVTAETAVVLPLLAIFTVGLVWMVSLATVHSRAVDAAREAARVVARGESVGAASTLARSVAGDARVRISSGGDQVTVVVSAPVKGPGGLFAFLPATTVSARAVAAREPES